MRVTTWASRFAVVAFGLLLFAGIPPRVAGSAIADLGSSRNPSPACSSVTFTATVFGIIPPPFGLVTFFDGLTALGLPEGLVPDTHDVLGVPLPTNHSSASISTSLGAGTHIITFGYAATEVGVGVSGPLVQEVTAAESTTGVTSSVDPSVFGQPVTWSADVSGGCSGGVAGSVQFRADGADIGSPQVVVGGHASFTTAGLAVGLHPVQAVFTSSDPNVLGSTGTLLQSLVLLGQRVDPAVTSTTLASSTNPSEFGASVTFSATTTVDAPGAGTPSGAVQFQDNGANLGSSVPVGGGGQAQLTTSSLPVGSHVISASYTSDSPNFEDSSADLTQVVNKARTTLTYDGDTTADFDDPAILSARLTRADNGAPIAGKTVALSMGSESCAPVTGAGGEAACTVVPTEPAGPFTATGVFAGDGDYITSTTSSPFIVTKEETTTVYTGSTVIAQGNPVTLSGRLLEDGTVPIAGRTLTLTLASGTVSQTCVTGATDASGDASCALATVSVGQGPQPVTATFAGDAYYLPSSDAKTVIIFAFPSHGIFTIGDESLAPTSGAVTYWDAQWSKLNTLSTGSAPSSFKGFADSTSSTPPACGGSWTSSGGTSSSPVGSVPAYMGTAVVSSVVKQGSQISGNIVHIVVVVTVPGYQPNAGHAGTGAVIATYC